MSYNLTLNKFRVNISWPFPKTRWFGSRRRHRTVELDAAHLSPHLLRDMGFLDGNDPRGRGW